MKNLKYSFEFFCSPIWILEENKENPIYVNANVVDLPINEHLKNEIFELDNIYQSKYNDEYPPEPLSLSEENELLFVLRVLKSHKLLEAELLEDYNIFFDNTYWNEKLAK